MKDRNLQHSDNWRTPKSIYNPLFDEFWFDFDPCPFNPGEITPENDGLLIEWGRSNFVNPPYSLRLKEGFILKAIEESKKGKICVLLIPVSTSTKIFHDHLWPAVCSSLSSEIRYIRGRVSYEKQDEYGKFYTPKGAGMHDSMIVVLNLKDMPI